MMVGGVMMIIVGITISWYLTETTPIGKAGMTEEEKINLLFAERENSDSRSLTRKRLESPTSLRHAG